MPNISSSITPHPTTTTTNTTSFNTPSQRPPLPITIDERLEHSTEGEGEDENENESVIDTGNSKGPWTVIKTKEFIRNAEKRAELSHNRIPGIRKVPLRAIGIISFIALLNAIVWIATGIVVVRLTLFEFRP